MCRTSAYSSTLCQILESVSRNWDAAIAHAKLGSGSDTNSDGTDVHQKQVEYSRTDGEEEEKASRRISHQCGGKGSSGDGDVAKKVQKNPGIVRENDSSDSSDFFPP